MGVRPDGIVTFLFTDIEGSTRLLRELGPGGYEHVLEDHRRILREQFARHGGYEAGTEGDSFMVAFTRPADAMAAAAESQAGLAAHPWPANGTVHVRMGVHTGEANATEGGYVGVAVHRAARIAAAAHGDQVLLSQATYDLVRDLDLGYRLTDLGRHRFKDLDEPQTVYQLDAIVSEPVRHFPPLRTAAEAPTNLPAQLTALIGREQLIAELADLCRRDEARLVTLTGAGGTGKTRLALATGAALLADFPDGVWFVPLGAISDPALVVAQIAAALSLNEAAGQSLAAYLDRKQLLLILDNFEQVVEAAPLIGQLLAEAAGVRLLVTTREALRLSGEHVFPVPALAPADSVALFVRRAQAIRPAFELNAANANTIAQICARLDGLPLAIELAAARITLMSPEQMLQRLGDRLRLLTGGSRDMPLRHQTLRAALEWSHGLLNEAEQALFARLSVFAGGFSLDAAETACGAEIEGLASLVDKSLVRVDGDRFAMLETIGEYAAEQLQRSPAPDAVGQAHADYYEALVATAYQSRIVAESELSGQLEQDLGNIRLALDLLERTDHGRALAMAANLGWFWHVHSHLAEGRGHLTRLLDDSPLTGLPRARALAALGEVAAWQGDPAAAKEAMSQAIATFEELGLQQERALAMYELGWALFIGGEDEEARRRMEESLSVQRRLGDELLINRAKLGLVQMLVALGEVDQVEVLATESLDASRRLGDLRGEHFAHHFLADAALIGGDVATAERRYRDALRAAVPLRDRIEICFEVQGVAMSLAGTGRLERAVRLAAAAETELASLGVDTSGVRFWNELLDRYIGSARSHLGEPGLSVSEAAGRQMGMSSAIEEALQS